MDLQYLISKNNENTFTVNSVYFHSSYNPTREAERFVETYNFQQKEPDLIVIVEPGFSYLYTILKNKFPKANIGCIRIIKNLETNHNIKEVEWDFILSTDNLYQQLISKFTEMELVNSEMIVWKPAEQLYSTEILNCFKNYKESINYSKTILTTRQYFEKKWFINSIIFFLYGKDFYSLNPDIKNQNLPVVIAASGPSLNDSLCLIKKYISKIFLICLSSALPVLIENEIIPDLVMSTDGGYYANEHLKPLTKKNIPLALSPESYVSKKILKNNPLILLNYNDGISNKLTNLSKIEFSPAERNGTVSGTALRFAQSITNNAIYFLGLDLSFSKGFQHTQPNQLELNASITDNNISSKEQRIARSQMNKNGLDIYKDWFASQNDMSKIYRVINKPENKLGMIKDISSTDFCNYLADLKIIEKNSLFLRQNISKNNITSIKNYIFNNEEELFKQIFPVDYINLKHCINDDVAEKAKENLKNKAETLMKKIRRIVDYEN